MKWERKRLETDPESIANESQNPWNPSFRRPGVSRENGYGTHMRSKPRARCSQDGDSPTDENQALGRLLGKFLHAAFYFIIIII